MSKALDDMRKDAAVIAAIDTYREKQVSDDTVIERIMNRFHLTRDRPKICVNLQSGVKW